MTIPELLRVLARRGIEVQCEGDTVMVAPVSKVKPVERQLLARHRHTVRRLLLEAQEEDVLTLDVSPREPAPVVEDPVIAAALDMAAHPQGAVPPRRNGDNVLFRVPLVWDSRVGWVPQWHEATGRKGEW